MYRPAKRAGGKVFKRTLERTCTLTLLSEAHISRRTTFTPTDVTSDQLQHALVRPRNDFAVCVEECSGLSSIAHMR
jgi:hypothetical protein